MTRNLWLPSLLALALAACSLKMEDKLINPDVHLPEAVEHDGDASQEAVNPCDLAPQCPTEGVCAAVDVKQHTCDRDTGVWTCKYPADYEPEEKSCDNKDNNCDGNVDENILDATAAKCLHVGVCATGVVAQCNTGAWVCDYSKVAGFESPRELSCDKKDNDCDGKTDEELNPAQSTCKLEGVCLGAVGGMQCKEGAWTCTAAYDSLNLEGGPVLYQEAEDLCDGQDNDCDGLTDTADPDFPEVGDPMTACLNPDGTSRADQGVCAGNLVASCVDGAWDCGYASVNGFAELEFGEISRCDGKDNNCDGDTDEGLAGIAASQVLACIHTGVCASLQLVNCVGGVWDCNYQSLPDYHAGTEYDAAQQIGYCDLKDNDCDGSTDEDLTNLPDSTGFCQGAKGVCAGKIKKSCVSGAWVCTMPDGVTGYEPTEKACDNQDNDCDGLTDEGLLVTASEPALLDGYCGSGTPKKIKGVCEGATVAYCDADPAAPSGKSWKCVRSSPDYEPVEAACDNKDNDCDGLTDGQDPDVQNADAKKYCPAYGVCTGHQANFVCSSGLLLCSYTGMGEVAAYQPNGENLCDGQDNDCDGLVDENPSLDPDQVCPRVGVCATAPLASINAECDAGQVVCSFVNVPGYEEGSEYTCDNQDNDCDGLTDEDLFSSDTAGCVTGVGVCISGARKKCVAGQWKCDYGQVVGYEPDQETMCDKQDNDCDGATDEGITDPSGVHCSHQGVCDGGGAGGTCVNGVWQCAYGLVQGYEPSEATCDGRDNDCDGSTDEGVCGATGDLCVDGNTCTISHQCRTNITGQGTFCAAGATDCVYSESGDFAITVAKNGKRCVDDGAYKICGAGGGDGIWGAPVTCPSGTPYCTDLVPDAPCSYCLPGSLLCLGPFGGVDTVGECLEDGTNYVKNDALACAVGTFCVGPGVCVSSNELTVNSTTVENQKTPAIAYSRKSGFLVVWASDKQDGDKLGIFGRRYTAEGQVLTQEFQVNSVVANDQAVPTVAAAPDGSFVVAWTSKVGTDTGDVFVRKVSSTGAVGDPEIRVNDFTTGKQDVPEISINSKGDALLVWESEGKDLLGTGIAGRLIHADLTMGDELLVNDPPYDGKQRYPRVAALTTDHFATVWQSEARTGSTDSSGLGVFGKLYNASGIPDGVELGLTAYTTNNQYVPRVTAMTDGKFAVIWTSQTPSGKYQVRGRSYSSTGSPLQPQDMGISEELTGAPAPLALAVFPDNAMWAVWQVQQTGTDGFDLFGRQVTAGFVSDPATSFAVPQFTAGNQTLPAIVATDTFLTMSAWEAPEAGTQNTDIHARLQPRK